MKQGRKNKKMLVSMVAFLSLSMLAFVLVPGKSTLRFSGDQDENGQVKMEENYNLDDQRQPEAPANERMLISVFKFIVNCNPFRKEAQL